MDLKATKKGWNPLAAGDLSIDLISFVHARSSEQILRYYQYCSVYLKKQVYDT